MRAGADRDEAAKLVERAEDRWLSLEGDGQQLVLGALRRVGEDRDHAETRLQAAQDALDATPAEAPVDALVDFAAGLQAAVRGIDTDADRAGSMAQVNAALPGPSRAS